MGRSKHSGGNWYDNPGGKTYNSESQGKFQKRMEEEYNPPSTGGRGTDGPAPSKPKPKQKHSISAPNPKNKKKHYGKAFDER